MLPTFLLILSTNTFRGSRVFALGSIRADVVAPVSSHYV